MTVPSIADLYASDSGRTAVRLARPGIASAVVLAGVGGALTGASPTGNAAFDLVWAGGVAAGVAGLGSRCGIGALLWTTIAGALAGAGSGYAVASLVAGALVVAIAAGGYREPSALIGAAAAGIAVQSVLRAPDLVGSRSSAAAAVVVVGPLVVSGWRRTPTRVRRVAVWGLTLVGAVGVAVSLSAAVVAWRLQDRIEFALSEARAGLDAGRRGDLDVAVERLTAAGRELDAVAVELDGWSTRPALAVPGVGANLQALVIAAREGSELANAASTLLDAVDVDDLLVDGAVDVGNLATMTGPVRSSRDTIAASLSAIEEGSSPWLVPSLQSRYDELTSETISALDTAQRAIDALSIAPTMLGADTPQRYLVLFGTPSETREGGGIVANVVEVLAEDGRLSLGPRARNLELNLLSRATTLRDVESYPTRFVEGEPWRYSQNWTATPDFPTTARAVGDLYPQMGGSPLDGVIYVDPFGLEALLALTGPVIVEGLREPLTADTAAEFLLVGQYTQFPDLGDRVDFLDGAAAAVFDALLQLPDLPSLGTLADTLGPAADGRHLMIAGFRPDVARVLSMNRLDGAFPTGAAVDQVAVIQSNLGADKLDAYLHRSISYGVATDRTAGAFDAVLQVVVESTATAGLPPHVVGVPDDGVSFEASEVLLSVYTPSDIVSTLVDGEPWAVEHRSEFGLNRYVVPITVEPGAPVVVEWRLRGFLARGSYDLAWVEQAMVNADEVTVTIDGRRVR